MITAALIAAPLWAAFGLATLALCKASARGDRGTGR